MFFEKSMYLLDFTTYSTNYSTYFCESSQDYGSHSGSFGLAATDDFSSDDFSTRPISLFVILWNKIG